MSPSTCYTVRHFGDGSFQSIIYLQLVMTTKLEQATDKMSAKYKISEHLIRKSIQLAISQRFSHTDVYRIFETME